MKAQIGLNVVGYVVDLTIFVQNQYETAQCLLVNAAESKLSANVANIPVVHIASNNVFFRATRTEGVALLETGFIVNLYIEFT